MSYESGYIVFGALFVGSIAAYWIVTRAFRDPDRIYEVKSNADA